MDRSGLCPEGLHGLQSMIQDVAHGAAPAAVDRPDDPVLAVEEQGGHAVGGEAEDRQALLRGHDAVGLVGDLGHADMPVRGAHDAHGVFVDLVGHCGLVDPHAQQRADAAVILPHRLRIVAPVGAQVECGKVARAHAAEAGGEGVPGPDQLRAHIYQTVFVFFNKCHSYPLKRVETGE